MRRLLLALAFLGLAVSPAGAQNTRLAVIINSQTGNGVGTLEAYYLCDFMLLRQLGIDFDVYDASLRTWGETAGNGKADSTWFRERYGAIYIPYLQDNNNRGVNSYATKFLNGSGVPLWDKSPITGKWSIPVYIKAPAFGLRVETESPTLVNDSLRYGIIMGGASGPSTRPMPTAVIPADSSLGTWRDRSLTNLRPGFLDTLYNRPAEIAIRSATGMLGQYVAAVTWLDTTLVTVAADTILTTWRYKPLGPTTPGAVYTILDNAYTTTSARITGSLVLLQLMLSESTVKAQRKIPLAYTIHHFQSGRTPDANTDAMIDGLLDVHERAGIYSYFGMKVSQVEWAAGGGGGPGASRTSWDRLNQHLNNRYAVWFPHSHATDYDGNEADSAAFRGFYNAMLNTASHPDSFNLPRARYSPLRIVPANDLMTKAAAVTHVRAGMRVLEAVLAAQTTGADRFTQPPYAMTSAIRVPGEAARFYTKTSFDIGLQGDFATFKGTVSFAERVRSTVSATIEKAILGDNGIYQHYDALAGNTAGTPYTDRFNEWIIEHVVGGYPKVFNKVVTWDRPGTDPRIIAPMRTAR